MAEATTADLPPLPVGFTGDLLLIAFAIEAPDGFGVAGNLRRSFWLLALSPLPAGDTPPGEALEPLGFEGGGVGVGAGVGE